MKKVISLALFVLLVVSLTACGQGGGNNSVSSPYDATAFLTMDYKAAETALRDAGFEQILLNAVEDLSSSGEKGDGIVSAVSIAGDSYFAADTKYDKTAEIIITYHCAKRLTAPLSAEDARTVDYMEVGKQFFDAGFLNVETDEVYDLPSDAEYETVLSANGNPIEDPQIPFDSNIRVIGHYPVPLYSTSIVIDFESNWFFNKYDVVVSLNGEELGSLDHGEDHTYELQLPLGTYQLSFTKEKEDNVSSSVSLLVNSSTSANYHISCYSSDEIRVKENGVTHQLADDGLMLPYSSNHYLRKNYRDVVDELEAAGFSKVNAEPVTANLWTPSQLDSVVAVTVDGTSDFARDHIVKKSAPVSVQYHVADFAFKETAVSVTEKDTFELQYTMTSGDSIDSLTFSIDRPDVLQRNDDGSFTALIPGTATVTVSGGESEYSSCTVEVAEIIVPVEKLQFASDELDIVVGSTFSPEYKIIPENANYTDMTVQLSGQEIERNEDGTYYANEPGDVEISYYQDDRLIGSFTVHASVVDVESLTLDADIKEVNMGEEVPLPFVLTPDNATCKGITAVSSKPGIADLIFDERGEPVIKVKGVAAGKAVITVTIPNGTKYTQEIKVVEVVPTEIAVAQSSPEGKIEVGDLIALDVTWNPENTSVKDLTWSSSDKKVIKINSDGTLEAVGVGTAEIKAKHKSGKSGKISLTVEPTPVESITLSNDWDGDKKFVKGKTLNITATVLPENATNKKVTYKSDDEGVAKVSDKGVVTAVGVGTTTITAVSKDGPSSSFSVTVAPAPQKFRITWSANMISNDHVGYNWRTSFYVDGEAFRSGSTLTLEPDSSFTIALYCEEYDDYTDSGYYKERIEYSAELCKNGYKISDTVYVRENAGRYSGHYADWKINITITPVN